MSSTIWTQEELSANQKHLQTLAWRVVEAQHKISTMKVVDTAEEQNLLEDLIEATKPAFSEETDHLHYLLSTPFRYTRSGNKPSRFRKSLADYGIFYAAYVPDTAIAEIAFYRLLFFAESPETKLPTNPAEYTCFSVALNTYHAADLTQPPFNKNPSDWISPDQYEYCQNLAEHAYAAGTDVISYTSVRDPQHRLNYAVLNPSAFACTSPQDTQSWRIHIQPETILAKCESPVAGLTFLRADFEADPRLQKTKAPHQRHGA